MKQAKWSNKSLHFGNISHKAKQNKHRCKPITVEEKGRLPIHSSVLSKNYLIVSLYITIFFLTYFKTRVVLYYE